MDHGANTVAGSLYATIATLLSAGELEAAKETAEAAMMDRDRQIEAICALAAIHYRVGAMGNAVKLLSEVADLPNAPADVSEILAVLHCLTGSLNNALYFAKLSGAMPPDHNLLPLFGKGFPSFADAFAHIRHKPLLLRATALAAAEDYENATFVLKQHLLLDPGDVEALDRYADILVRMGKVREAVGMLRSVVTLAGPTATIFSRLGRCLTALGEHQQAEACHEAALARAPKSIAILAAMLADLRYTRREGVGVSALAARWTDAILAAKPKNVRPAPAFSGADKINIGYLCTADHGNATKQMFLDVLCGHDRSRFTLFGFGTGEREAQGNWWTRSTFDNWRDVGAMDIATLGALIRGENIHVLVDLDGLAAPDRSGLFLRNSAPLQLSWFNMPGDLRLPGNHRACVAGEAVEGELSLPFGRYFLGGTLAGAPDIGPAPMVENGAVTFGCDITLAQLTPRFVMHLGRILNTVPGSMVLLRDDGLLAESETINRVIEIFGNAGIAHRIDVLHTTTRAEFAAAIDIALAPFPVADVLAHGELLALGIPVVVLAASEDGGDLAASMMAAGCGHLAAADADLYVAVAVKEAADPGGIQAFRSGARAQLAACPAFSAKGFTGAFENAVLAALDCVVKG